MKIIGRFLLSVALLLGVASFPQVTPAQITSNTASVTVTYNVSESITVSATPTTIALTAGSASPVVTITTAWNLSSTHGGGINIVAYFASSNALVSGGSNIPSSAISCTVDGTNDGAMTATEYGETNTCSNASLGHATTQVVLTGSNLTGTQNDTLTLTLASGTYAAGSYSGTLNVVALTYS